jgi:hypothetical protein
MKRLPHSESRKLPTKREPGQWPGWTPVPSFTGCGAADVRRLSGRRLQRFVRGHSQCKPDEVILIITGIGILANLAALRYEVTRDHADVSKSLRVVFMQLLDLSELVQGAGWMGCLLGLDLTFEKSLPLLKQ